MTRAEKNIVLLMQLQLLKCYRLLVKHSVRLDNEGDERVHRVCGACQRRWYKGERVDHKASCAIVRMKAKVQHVTSLSSASIILSKDPKAKTKSKKAKKHVSEYHNHADWCRGQEGCLGQCLVR